MKALLPKLPAYTVRSSKKPGIPVYFIDTSDVEEWQDQLPDYLKHQIAERYDRNASEQVLSFYNERGLVQAVAFLCEACPSIYHAARLGQHLKNSYSAEFIQGHVFLLESRHNETETINLLTGWGLGAYRADFYKTEAQKQASYPVLKIESTAIIEKSRVQVDSIILTRNLINQPANFLGTLELADAARNFAKKSGLSCKIIKGSKLESEFPLIHAVGKASPRPPLLIELKSNGDKDLPLVTLVGKGIIYDTGGLNLKPGQFMRDMKKDMGGAAHVLGLAGLITGNDLPVRLRVLIPVAENSVAGNSFRPGDVLPSRKGLSVEIGDTDAEGRLVVADALTYAGETQSDLTIDFCTLTGAARVALGYDIPAYFTHNDQLREQLLQAGQQVADPVWPLPIWQGYRKEMNSTIADICNDATGGRAGAIHGALFLNEFVEKDQHWLHFDCYAWEQNGKPGRPKGGADTGLLATYEFLRRRYPNGKR